MLQGITQRLSRLESAMMGRAIPSLEEWKRQWAEMPPILQSFTILNAENLDDFFRDDPVNYPYQKAIAGYLVEMGIVDPDAPSLREEAAELWADYPRS